MISTSFPNDQQFAIITIKRDPVNSMNLELWQELWKALEECEATVTVRGILWTQLYELIQLKLYGF